MIKIVGPKTDDPKAPVTRPGVHKRLIDQFLVDAPNKPVDNKKREQIDTIAEADNPARKNGL